MIKHDKRLFYSNLSNSTSKDSWLHLWDLNKLWSNNYGRQLELWGRKSILIQTRLVSKEILGIPCIHSFCFSLHDTYHRLELPWSYVGYLVLFLSSTPERKLWDLLAWLPHCLSLAYCRFDIIRVSKDLQRPQWTSPLIRDLTRWTWLGLSGSILSTMPACSLGHF